MNRLAKLFGLNKKGLNIPRGLGVAVVMVAPLVVLGLLDLEKYWISLAFAALFVGLSDPGGDYRVRVREMGGVALIGAVLTAVGFAIGDGPWGWVVLAVFLVTLLSGLAIKFGVHRFVAGMLLNAWFLVILGLPNGFAAAHITTSAWAQTLAWVIGAAIWIVASLVWWLARGEQAQPSHVPEIPGTKQVVLFALIRAVALAISVAIAFGLDLPEAYWMPIATLVAMKPSLDQSVLVAEQRLAGAILGAVLAALFLLTVTNQHVLEVVIVVLGAIAASIRIVNYTLYNAAIAGLVLIALDVAHPSDFATEGRRVLFTVAGVGIGVAVMFLANLLQKRRAVSPSPAT